MSGYAPTPGTLEHLLLKCPVLTEVRSNAVSHWSAYLVDKPYLLPIVSYHTLYLGIDGKKLHLQLLLDPNPSPLVIDSLALHV